MLFASSSNNYRVKAIKKSRVFEETYSRYLAKLAEIDLASRADQLGAKASQSGILIPFYNRKYLISKQGVLSQDEQSPSFAVRVVLCKYVLMCPEEVSVEPHLVTFREFKDAGPLVSYFTNNTYKTLETTYSGSLNTLRERCLEVGGLEKQSATYDLSMEFLVLPKIPVVLNFNDRDDMFPAACSLLYLSSAESYLDMECLAITATYLTGMLI